MKTSHGLGMEREPCTKRDPLLFMFSPDDSISRLRSPAIEKTMFAKIRYTSIVAHVRYRGTIRKRQLDTMVANTQSVLFLEWPHQKTV